jgi:hypothetical protein
MCNGMCRYEDKNGNCRAPKNSPCAGDYDDESDLEQARADYEEAMLERRLEGMEEIKLLEG